MREYVVNGSLTSSAPSGLTMPIASGSVTAMGCSSATSGGSAGHLNVGRPIRADNPEPTPTPPRPSQGTDSGSPLATGSSLFIIGQARKVLTALRSTAGHDHRVTPHEVMRATGVSFSRVVEHQHETRAAYDGVVELYASLFADRLETQPFARAMIGIFADLVRSTGNRRVADVGCGPGHLTALLHDQGLDAFGL